MYFPFHLTSTYEANVKASKFSSDVSRVGFLVDPM